MTQYRLYFKRMWIQATKIDKCSFNTQHAGTIVNNSGQVRTGSTDDRQCKRNG